MLTHSQDAPSFTCPATPFERVYLERDTDNAAAKRFGRQRRK